MAPKVLDRTQTELLPHMRRTAATVLSERFIFYVMRGGKQDKFFGRNWLGWQDSNLRMPVPKTGALPLGYTPRPWGRCIARPSGMRKCLPHQTFHRGDRFSPEGSSARFPAASWGRSRGAACVAGGCRAAFQPPSRLQLHRLWRLSI